MIIFVNNNQLILKYENLWKFIIFHMLGLHANQNRKGLNHECKNNRVII